MNNRKRSRSDPGISATPTKRAKNPVLGPAFMQAIDNITAPVSGDVYTHVSVPMTYSATHKPFSLDLHATFSAMDHNSTTDNTAWRQGWMEMGGETSYEKVLPANLGLRQATVESRVMKKLALGGAYTPKTTRFTDVTRKDQMPGATKNWGRTAVQSYLEDITGRTSLNLQDVGSGMRAMTLASKLRMKTGGTASEAGFRDKMRKAFPQLLTGDTNPVGGAAHYNTVINTELTATPGNSATQQKLRRKVVKAHDEVNRESRNRFNHKWSEIEAGRMTTTQAGQWWINRFGAGVSGANSLSGTGVKKRTIRRAYVGNKLGRHGITHIK